MVRPTYIEIDIDALAHNAKRVKQCCPGQKIIAMVKADAYGCGLALTVPTLSHQVDAFGVACLEEARVVRQLTTKPCVLFQGVFSQDEFQWVSSLELDCVIHHADQLTWLLNTTLPNPVRIWVKVNTGMHRLGFQPDEVYDVLLLLSQCQWVHPDIGLMTHIACADEPEHPQNQLQLDIFSALNLPADMHVIRSIGNSAWILSRPKSVYDVVRPGIMLYGVSPMAASNGADFNLRPVMRFISSISVIHDYPPGVPIGYGGTWRSEAASRIGVVAVGYGDGYPRHITENTPVWIRGSVAPIVGRVSMDMLTVDLTSLPDVEVGDRVELWGEHLPVEVIARAAGTIAYELICQVSPRVRDRARIVSMYEEK